MTTLKLLPEAGGGYTVQPAGVVSLDDKVVSISALDADTGVPANASQSVFAGLRNGITVNGVLLVVTNSSARIYRPAAAKGAHKAWDDYSCEAANVVHFGAQGYVLVGLFSKHRKLPLLLTASYPPYRYYHKTCALLTTITIKLKLIRSFPSRRQTC